MTLKQINETLPKNFIQIHRSYIVNMKMAVTVERLSVTLDDSTVLPVSDTRRGFLQAYINGLK